MPELSNHAKIRCGFSALGGGGFVFLKRATSFRITGESGKVVVHTLDGTKTFAGFSPGEAIKSIEVSGVIARSGPEFDFEKHNFDESFVGCQYWIGPDTYAGAGQITSYSVEDSTNAALSYTTTWTGEAKAAT